MYIKVGIYTINTDNITHAQYREDSDEVEVFFVGGPSVTLRGEDAAYFLKVTQRLTGF